MAVLESHNGYYLWNYIPSTVAAVIFILLFLTAAFAHFWRMYTTGSKFCVPFVIGCFFEFIGYCARASARNKTGKLMPYIIQNFFILVAPALFAASIYMTLGRIIRSVKGERLSVIRVSRLTKTFVIGDIMSFMVQGGSAGLMFQSSTVKFGEAMVVGGLFIQIVMFGLFALTAILFQSRLRRNPTPESYNIDVPWKESLHMLYGVSALIMIRSIFRVVEYLLGQTGYPLKHEWTLYLFDSLLMFLVTVIFYIRYPNKLQQGIGSNEDLRMISQQEDGKV